MQDFVCIRHQRLKALGWGSSSAQGSGYGMIGRWAHHLRLITTANADQKLTGSICLALASTNWAPRTLDKIKQTSPEVAQLEHLTNLAKARYAALGISSWKSDAVLLEELHLSLSPEFLRDGDLNNPQNPATIKRARDAKLDFLKRKYGDNLIAFIDHPDESNYHAIAFIVPAMRRLHKPRGRPRKTGQVPREPVMAWGLCAKRMFSPTMCSQNQDDFAKVCRQHNLKVRRGVMGSRTNNVEMRAHLALVQQPAIQPDFISVPDTKGILESKVDYATRVRESVAAQTDPINRQLSQYHAKALEFDRESAARKDYQNAAVQAQDQLSSERSKSEVLAKENEVLRAQTRENANKVRDIPLTEVAKALGFIPRDSGHFFTTPLGELKVGHSFFSFTEEGHKGRNAVDLVKLATGSDFKTSVRWLLAHFPTQCAAATSVYFQHACEQKFQAAVETGPLTPSENSAVTIRSDESTWPAVRSTLVEKIPKCTCQFDHAHSEGRLFTTSLGHVAVALVEPENDYHPTGLAVLDPRTLEPRQIVGRGMVALNPDAKVSQLTIAPSWAEALSHSADYPKEANILVPVRQLLADSFWTWARHRTCHIKLLNQRRALDWIPRQAREALQKAGLLFDGLIEAMFSGVEGQHGDKDATKKPPTITT